MWTRDPDRSVQQKRDQESRDNVPFQEQYEIITHYFVLCCCFKNEFQLLLSVCLQFVSVVHTTEQSVYHEYHISPSRLSRSEAGQCPDALNNNIPLFPPPPLSPTHAGQL